MTSNSNETLERVARRIPIPDAAYERLLRRRDRKRRNQRIAAGVVGIAVFVAAIGIVTGVSSLDRTEDSVIPGGGVTGPVETGPSETGHVGTQGGALLPVSVTDYLVDLETGARTPLPESIVGTEDVTEGYAVSPDGSRLAYVGRGDKGEIQIFVANLDGTGIEQVTAELRGEASPSGAGPAPAWSPDGSKIAYVGSGGPHGWGGHVYVLDLTTGVSTQVTDDLGDGGATAPSFTPDGSSIIYGAYRKDWPKDGDRILMIPVAGGASVTLVGGNAEPGLTPTGLSPDGSLLGYACFDEYGGDLCLANADGTDPRVLVEGAGAGRWSPDGTRIVYGTWPSGVHVVDVATGEVTLVDGGWGGTWLDDHTLIVEADHCSLPSNAGCAG